MPFISIAFEDEDILATWAFDQLKLALNQLQKTKSCPLLLPTKPSKEKNPQVLPLSNTYMKFYGKKFYGITFLLTCSS